VVTQVGKFGDGVLTKRSKINRKPIKKMKIAQTQHFWGAFETTLWIHIKCLHC